MKSIWTRDINLKAFPAAKRDIKVEVLVIGGGMTGLLCGYFLKQQGADYALIEGRTLCGGVTGNTTAKITAYHGLIYSRLTKETGSDAAASYLKANTAALSQYRAMAKEIDCDFLQKDNYIYSMENKRAVLEEVEAIARIGGAASYMERVEIPMDAVCAVKAPGQAQFHPLKFAAAISEGQHIYEHTQAGDIRKVKAGYSVSALNDLGQEIRIRAGKVIVATHFPYLDRWGWYFLKMHQQRSYVLALTGADGSKLQALSGMYLGVKGESKNPLNLSFRTFGDFLLLGGGGGRTGTGSPSYDELRKAAKQLYPGSREQGAWAAQDCMTLDSAPYVGPYAKGKDGLLVATGFNKWGMTGAMAAAMTLTGKLDAEVSKVFRPDRTILRPQLAANILETAKSFLRPAAPRCTHLGCALKWNETEKSWDCACHGSGFTQQGAVVNGPAQNPLKP